MVQYSHSNSVMEARNHFKNGASPKSQMSRINLLFFIGITIVAMCSCQSKLSIEEMSSKELLQKSLESPVIGLIFAFNDPCATGISRFMKECPEFRELYFRSDFTSVLIEEYSKFDPLAIDPKWSDLQTGQYTFHFLYIEFFLSQKVNQIEKPDLRYLKEMAISNYQKKKMRLDVYGMGLASSAALCASIIMNVNPDILEVYQDIYGYIPIHRFICSLVGVPSGYFDEIVDVLKNIEI